MKTDRLPVVMLSSGSVQKTLRPKENVFGETLQNFWCLVVLDCCCGGFEVWLFFVILVYWGFFFARWGGAGRGVVLFSLLLGAYYCAISFSFL